MTQRSRQRTAGIYVRISDDKAGNALGIGRQEADCRKLSADKGFTVGKVYADNDISAYSGKRRPAYQELLADIRSGDIDAVITWHTDRLHRSPLELEEYVELSETSHVVTHTVTSGTIDLATPTGRMLARTIGALARYESEHKAERITRKNREKAEAGEPHGGAKRIFGFESDGKTVRDSEADEIRKMTFAVIAGESIGSIIRDLNDRRVTSARGNRWSYVTVRTLILRERNAGRRQYQGKVIGKAQWAPIVSPSDFDRARRILLDPARRTTKNSGRRHLLSGIAKCGVCGKGMKSGGSKTRSGTPFKVYRCCTTRNMSKLEEFVVDCAKAVVYNQSWEAPRGLESVNEELLQSLAEADRKASEAASAFADDDISIRQLTQINKDLEAERARLSARLVDVTPTEYAYFIGMPNGIDFDSLALNRRRQVLESLFEIRVLPVGKGSNKKGLSIGDGVDISFLGQFAHGFNDLESMLMAARLSPRQVGVMARAVQTNRSEFPTYALLTEQYDSV